MATVSRTHLSAAALLALLITATFAAAAESPAPETVAGDNSSVVVTFATHGVKEVRLTVGNDGGESTMIKNIVVLDPRPSVMPIIYAPTLPHRCETLDLSVGAAGQPPLSYAWEIRTLADQHVATLASTSQTSWLIPAATPPGVYIARVEVSNASPPPAVATQQFVLADLDLVFSPVAESDYPGRYTFSVDVPEAVEWSYDLDLDQDSMTTIWTPWSTEPTAVGTYLQTGMHTARVRIRTCMDPLLPDGIEGQPLLFEVEEIFPDVFDDGFESGLLDAWALAEPPA